MVTRALTQAQIFRRSAIVVHLIGNIRTADELREHLARIDHLPVTVDTVQRDLRAMERDDIVRCGRHPTAGHKWGGGRWIAYNGWRLGDAMRRQAEEAAG